MWGRMNPRSQSSLTAAVASKEKHPTLLGNQATWPVSRCKVRAVQIVQCQQLIHVPDAYHLRMTLATSIQSQLGKAWRDYSQSLTNLTLSLPHGYSSAEVMANCVLE